ncbi:MAG: hypothetical protein HOV81_23990 [Kofleriaceae bacterium]|nr:hypothetical protein [Kofleriaceae bacterium]
MKRLLTGCVLVVLVACKGKSEPAPKPEVPPPAAHVPAVAGDNHQPAATATPAKRDARLNALGRLSVNWPPAADNLSAAIAAVEANIGPGTKQPNGSLVWAAMVDAENAAEIGEGCNRITLEDEGGKLRATKETLKPAHPDFGACASLSAAQFK